MKHPVTYILVADGARGRIFSSSGIGKPLKDVPGGEYRQELKPDHELQSDRPGRAQESANPARHAIEREDLHRKKKEQFIAKLAEELDERLAKNEFQRLVIAAPPEALGHIRAALSDKLRATVTAEIGKDLTKMSLTEIHANLSKEIPL